MRVSYRKFTFIDPKQLNELQYENLKKSTDLDIPNSYKNLNVFRDLKLELIFFGIIIFLFIIELIIPNTIIEVVLCIALVFLVIKAFPTVSSYIELRIYNAYYNNRLKADLKNSKSFEEFRKKRISRRFYAFD